MEWVGLLEFETDVANVGTKMEVLRHIIAEDLATRMEEWAQDNASWADRTGAARSGLHGWAEHDESHHVSTAYISHGVDYGWALEILHHRQYQIIAPTIIQFAHELPGLAQEDAHEIFTGGNVVSLDSVSINRGGQLFQKGTGRFVGHRPSSFQRHR